jgi:hypothetical protein
MRFFCVVAVAFCLLSVGCSKSQDDEMEEVEKIVLADEEGELEWGDEMPSMISEREGLEQEMHFLEDLQCE